MTLRYKRYKFGKVKPNTEKKMIELRKKGVTIRLIAKKFGVTETTVTYHTNKRNNKLVKEYGKRKVETKEGRLKEKEYIKKYIKERYNNDPEFRERHLKLVKKSMKERRLARKKKGLCSSCGGKLLNDNFFECEKCRKKSRDSARSLKESKSNKQVKRWKW